MNKFISKAEKETFNFGLRLAKNLKGGEIIALKGNLGAGKTVLTKGIAKGLGVREKVNSPTFVIMKIYKTKSPKLKIKKLIHIDCYRLRSLNDAVNVGADEYFNQSDAVVVIEWPQKLKKILPKKTKKIVIKILGSKRIISLE